MLTYANIAVLEQLSYTPCGLWMPVYHFMAFLLIVVEMFQWSNEQTNRHSCPYNCSATMAESSNDATKHQYYCGYFVEQLDFLLYIDEHRAESCLYSPVLEARFTEVLSVLARRKGGIIRWDRGEVSGLFPVRLHNVGETQVVEYYKRF